MHLRRATRVAALLFALPVAVLSIAAPACSRGTSANASSTTVRTGPPPTLPFASVSQDELGRQASLSFPAGTAEFLTARLENQSQMDVTFTLPQDQVAAFLAGSNLRTPVAGKRVVTHTSPLWKLNPGVEIRGTTDIVTTPAGVRLRRAVELVEEPGGRVRIRMVVSPA